MKNGESVIKLGDFRKKSADMLTGLLADLDTHNKEQSAGAQMGKTLGKFLIGVMDDEKPNMQQAQMDVGIETAQEARVGLAEFTTKHQKVLDRFGLTLSHQASEGLKYGLPSGPISMRIDNIHSFLRYAQSLPTSDEKNGTAEAFQPLLRVVEKQIASINFRHLSPEEKSLLENIDALSDSFRRLSPGLDLGRLQHFADYQNTNRLEQYLAVEREDLWVEPGKGFGPADWIRDTTPDNLDSRWSSAIKILREQEALGSAGVAKELYEHLKICIGKTKERFASQKTPYPQEMQEKFPAVIEKYEKVLEV